MAEERGGGWWDSWYKAAKDKSTEVLQFVKRDLNEFSTAVKSEASNVVSSTTSALKDKLRLHEPESTANTMKRSVSSFFGQVSNVLNPTPDDEDEEAIVIHDSQPVVLTKFQGCYMTIHITPEPDFSYVSFESNVPQASYKDVISRVLETFQPGKFVLTVFANKTSPAAECPRELEKTSSFGDWLRHDIQYCRFKNYDLTYAFYSKFPS